MEASRDNATTSYFRAESDAVSLSRLICALSGLTSPPNGLIEAATASDTGGVVFWRRSGVSMLLPPFPVVGQIVAEGLETSTLRALLERDLAIGVLLIRMGEYAIGVFRGEQLVSSKVGTGLVHARHRQGGSSSHRFERHREKQIETFFARVCGHAREHLEPHAREIDHLAYGGERFTVLDFRKQCRILSQFDERVIPRLLGVRQPRQDSLSWAIDNLWSSTLMEWSEADLYDPSLRV